MNQEVLREWRDEYCKKFGLCKEGGKCQCKAELRFIEQTIKEALSTERKRETKMGTFMGVDMVLKTDDERIAKVAHKYFEELTNKKFSVDNLILDSHLTPDPQ